MTDTYLVEPDVGFINDIVQLGGGDVKKCFQCATCSVACPISPDDKPFPRKEMIATSWGLKDKVVGSEDIWLCHNCGDCTTRCPRGAKPGDVLSAVRSYAITEYAKPKFLAKAVNDPSKLPFLLGIPVAIFFVLGMILQIFGVDWLNFWPKGDEIVHSHFFSTWLVDLIFIPTSIWAAAVFALGLKNFMGDIHKNALASGKTDKECIDPKGFVEALIRVIPTILKHRKFDECTENKDRSTAHMMVLFGFLGLAVVTGAFCLALYVFQIHGPYSQINPIKWLANVSGIALLIGSILMIKKRRCCSVLI